MGRKPCPERNGKIGQGNPGTQFPTQSLSQSAEADHSGNDESRMKTGPVCRSKQSVRPRMKHRRARSVEEAPAPDLLNVTGPTTEHAQYSGAQEDWNEETENEGSGLRRRPE